MSGRYRRPQSPRRLVPLLSVFMAAACGDRPHGPESTVRAFLDALESGEPDRAMNFLSPRFTLRLWDGTPVADSEGFRRMLGWDVAAEGERRLEALETAGDTVTVVLEERNAFTNLLGLEPFQMEARFVVEDGAIAEERMRELTGPGGSSYSQLFAASLAPVLEWGESAAPGSVPEGARAGRITFDEKTARALLDLIRRYDASGGRER